MNSAQCTIPLHPAGIGFAVKYGEVYDAELTECLRKFHLSISYLLFGPSKH